jgi:hypothetical protein
VNGKAVVLMIGLFLIGVSMAENATYIFKNGAVEFGDFKRMSADSVYLEKTGEGAGRQAVGIPKASLSEVVFDSGNKLNLSLSEYPPASSSEPGKPALQPRGSAPAAEPSAAPQGVRAGTPPPLGSPFVYGGFSAVVPGLGQWLLGKPVKGAICFGAVGASVLGTMLAWNYTTKAYDDLERNRSAGGFFRDSDHRKFTFRLHGSQMLTCVSALLYLLTVADATSDAFTYDKHRSAVKPVITTTSTGVGGALAVAF